MSISAASTICAARHGALAASHALRSASADVSTGVFISMAIERGGSAWTTCARQNDGERGIDGRASGGKNGGVA